MIPFTNKKVSNHHKTLSQQRLPDPSTSTEYPLSPISPLNVVTNANDTHQNQNLAHQPHAQPHLQSHTQSHTTESPPRSPAIRYLKGHGSTQAPASSSYPPKSDELRTLENTRRGLLPSRFTFVEYNGLRILMTDAPKEDELGSYADLLLKHNVKTLVRVCEPTYDSKALQARMDNELQFFDLPFPDGSAPPNNVLQDWLNIVDKHFPKNQSSCPSKPGQQEAAQPAQFSGLPAIPPVLTVHCMAGLGRAPLLVAIALVERGMDPIDSVGFIRARRRGAINSRQLLYLEEYQIRKLPPQTPKSNPDTLKGLFNSKLKGSKTSLVNLGSWGRKTSRPPSPKNQL